MHSAKRPLTEKEHDSILPLSEANGISPNLTIRLQNVGSRIRKHVTEGYATNRYSHTMPSTPFSSPTRAKVPPNADTVIFRSANDILHDVFSTLPSGASPTTSHRKRERAESDTERDVEVDGSVGEDIDGEMHKSGADMGAVNSRPFKPLRRPRRAFLETRSLPATAMRFCSDPQSSGIDVSVDEDWSGASSGGSFEPAQFKS